MSERDQLLKAFEAHRKIPGAPYEEANFLDYLLARPKKKRAVYDSFRGLRRFNAFIDQVQLDHAVCFSIKDREANYPLDKFVARVIELRNSPKSSLASFGNQAKAGFGWQAVAMGNLVIGIPTLSLAHHTGLLLIGLALIASFNSFFIVLSLKRQRYMAKLHKRLLQAPR